MAAPAESKGYEACSGCGICTISCPVWWETRDVWFTPHGRAKALQGGATIAELADSVDSCRMCGACEPVCPEEIDLMGLVRHLRVELDAAGRNPWAAPPVVAQVIRGDSVAADSAKRLLLAGAELESRPELLQRVVESLGGADRVCVVPDDGRDLAWAFEAGAPLDPSRLDQFLSGLACSRDWVVIEGLLHRLLRERAPGATVRGFAETLLEDEPIVVALGARDLLVIDARGYHANHAALVRKFTDLRARTGCQMNLDLQRTAIPTCADALQLRGEAAGYSSSAISWMLEGREIDRIVVESAADLDAFSAQTELPVLHLATVVGSR